MSSTKRTVIDPKTVYSMTSGLKITLLASCALAVLLNCLQFAVGFSQHAQASFNPGWTEAGNGHTTVSALATSNAVAVTPVPSTAPLAIPDPGAARTATAQTQLIAAGLKPNFAASYLAVQAKTSTPWQLLAAVHHIETNQSGNTAIRSSAGALGPMQFMPATFAHYAQDGNSDGTKQITNFEDALLTAGRYLAAGGADKGKYANALYNYNHSYSYVNTVLAIATRLGL